MGSSSTTNPDNTMKLTQKIKDEAQRIISIDDFLAQYIGLPAKIGSAMFSAHGFYSFHEAETGTKVLVLPANQVHQS